MNPGTAISFEFSVSVSGADGPVHVTFATSVNLHMETIALPNPLENNAITNTVSRDTGIENTGSGERAVESARVATVAKEEGSNSCAEGRADGAKYDTGSKDEADGDKHDMLLLDGEWEDEDSWETESACERRCRWMTGDGEEDELAGDGV
ncbi:hypothetical protein AURDEDRAFT_124049 [Auricularia subglabra TFB-10046 SS5]|nr:hypothetical protein AURDEDRAFT_124049 [Auricularia subglabra TFB-10046 SS5]